MKNIYLFLLLIISSSTALAADCYATDRFYFGVEGGWVTGLGGISDIQLDTDSTMNGVSPGAIGRYGYLVGANVDYRCFKPLRIGVSYTYCDLNYFWLTGLQSSVATAFHSFLKGRMHTDIVLINGYIHLKELLPCKCQIPSIDPYITGGAGVNWNHLSHIREYVGGGPGVPSFLAATISSRTKSNFCGRFGLGVLTDFCGCLTLDVGGYIIYLGEIQSGSTRTSQIPLIAQPINRFSFKDNWIGSFFIGLKCHF